MVDTDRRPFVLIWEVTQACDLTCDHCRADAQPERHPYELSTEEAKSFFDDCRGFGGDQLVVLSGGDPLKRDDIYELVEYGDDLGLGMTMTPSGTTSLTPESVEELSDRGLRRMALSIDGSTPESHDGFRGEEGSFEQTVKVGKYASEAGLPLQINTTVCAQTVGELEEIRDLVEELGAVLWSVFFLVPVGRGIELDPISPGRAEDVMEWLCEVNQDSSFGIKTTEAPHYRRVMMQKKKNKTRTQNEGKRNGKKKRGPEKSGRRMGITAGDGFAFVSHTGEVFPSGFLPMSAGNVKDEDVKDIYRNSDLFEELREKDRLKGKCGECEFRNVCGGSRSRAYAYTGDPMESDPLCEYVPDGYEGKLPEQEINI